MVTKLISFSNMGDPMECILTSPRDFKHRGSKNQGSSDTCPYVMT